jgi:ATP-dependent Lhr-like helicase
VFAQSRRAAERLARDLNDRIPRRPACARAPRLALPPRARWSREPLKDGELRALVATSSLELGIDVGAIDLVCSCSRRATSPPRCSGWAAPATCSAARPKGRIVVTKGEELLEAAAVVRSIHERQLDRIAMPDAPLDVLAQQIVAAVAAESLDARRAARALRQRAPYRALTRETLSRSSARVAEPLPPRSRARAARSCGIA